MVLFKDKEVSVESFRHLADVVIFNQHLVNPTAKHPIEWEANVEEMDKMSWMTDFASIDILYILDREEDVRCRCMESRGQDFGGMWKSADIILVQLNDCLYPVKGINTRTKLKFACANTPEKIDEADDDKNTIQNVLFQAREQRRSLLQSRGVICEQCGFMDTQTALDLYKPTTNGVTRIEMIRFGALRPFEDVMQEFNNGKVLCLNCVALLNEDRDTNS